jgi:transcriptional regulator with XRE-family HTH domain
MGSTRLIADTQVNPRIGRGCQRKATMTTDNGRAFNEWLRAELKAKKMSQRQLAQRSGVDHSTISRLIRGDRMPSLGTATRLARGLREIRDDGDAQAALGLIAGTAAVPQNPTARVEYALRADEGLSEAQVRQVMEYYLAVRLRRFGRTYTSIGHADPAAASASAGPRPPMDAPHGRAPGMVGVGATPITPRTAPQRQIAPRPPVRPPLRSNGRP